MLCLRSWTSCELHTTPSYPSTPAFHSRNTRKMQVIKWMRACLGCLGCLGCFSHTVSPPLHHHLLFTRGYDRIVHVYTSNELTCRKENIDLWSWPLVFTRLFSEHDLSTITPVPIVCKRLRSHCTFVYKWWIHTQDRNHRPVIMTRLSSAPQRQYLFVRAFDPITCVCK